MSSGEKGHIGLIYTDLKNDQKIAKTRGKV